VNDRSPPSRTSVTDANPEYRFSDRTTPTPAIELGRDRKQGPTSAASIEYPELELLRKRDIVTIGNTCGYISGISG
jgi:hypothetical protein